LQGTIKILGVQKEKQLYLANLEDSPFYPDGKGGNLEIEGI